MEVCCLIVFMIMLIIIIFSITSSSTTLKNDRSKVKYVPKKEKTNYDPLEKKQYLDPIIKMIEQINTLMAQNSHDISFIEEHIKYVKTNYEKIPFNVRNSIRGAALKDEITECEQRANQYIIKVKEKQKEIEELLAAKRKAEQEMIQKRNEEEKRKREEAQRQEELKKLKNENIHSIFTIKDTIRTINSRISRYFHTSFNVCETELELSKNEISQYFPLDYLFHHYEKIKKDYDRRDSFPLNVNDYFSRIFDLNLDGRLKIDRNYKAIHMDLVEKNEIKETESIINQCGTLLSDFSKFTSSTNKFNPWNMMNKEKYGAVHRDYYDSILSISSNFVSDYLEKTSVAILNDEFHNIWKIESSSMIKSIWFYALQKPFSADNFEKAVELYYKLHKKTNTEINIAELYAIKQLGAENVLNSKVSDCLNNIPGTDYIMLASGLMWMGAYKQEQRVLQFMLEHKIELPQKLQERLHSLSNGGSEVTESYDVNTSDNLLYFDISALAWREEQYEGLFEQLNFQEKELTYSLAVREEDKEIRIGSGSVNFSVAAIAEKIKQIMTEEYGDDVKAESKDCVALSGNGEEKIDGILACSSQCESLGILTHVLKIGKKVNIKFYTLFMPTGNDIGLQKKQVLSMFNKLSPSVTTWESSIKESILVAIQQMLNDTPAISKEEIMKEEPVETGKTIF